MLPEQAHATWYRGNGMTETTAIIVSIVGTGIGMIGVIGLMLRILTTNIGKQFDSSGAQMKEMKADLSARIDETNRRIDDTNRRVENRFESLTSEMHQRFDRVHQELAENRERMAKLEGSLEGFLAGRRDRDAA